MFLIKSQCSAVTEELRAALQKLTLRVDQLEKGNQDNLSV